MGRPPVAEVSRQGWDNRTFRLGSDLTVRRPSGDWYALQVEKRQPALWKALITLEDPATAAESRHATAAVLADNAMSSAP